MNTNDQRVLAAVGDARVEARLAQQQGLDLGYAHLAVVSNMSSRSLVGV
jgi:hypothetical protein